MHWNPDIRSSAAERGPASFAVVDVETSGLNCRRDRILSLAVSTLSEDGAGVREFHTLLNPGCDPGPVHIHGLTNAKLQGAPEFSTIRDELFNLLAGRVLVAHNAAFDYDFLSSEFRRSGAELPTAERLCTLSLARRIELSTPDCRLGTLAAHYGIPQARAHDARDDVRVLTGVLFGLTADATRLGIPLPFLECPPRNDFQARHGLPPGRITPKVACPYSYPGRLLPGIGLTQGMKLAITGDTRIDRNTLIEMIESAGLEAMSSVSGRTSALVTNDPSSNSVKELQARRFATPVINEDALIRLLSNVIPGEPRGSRTSRPSTTLKHEHPSGPLAGRRVLVLGGTHNESAEWRNRIAELGGSAAVNMSASVTDVLALPGSEGNLRLAKARTLGLPIHADLTFAKSDVQTELPALLSLRRGQAIDLRPEVPRWTLRAAWNQSTEWAVDITAFLVDDDEKVAEDADFIFYNQPGGTGVELTTDGPSEQSVIIDLEGLPSTCSRIIVCGALDGDGTTFGDVGAIEIELAAGSQSSISARSTLDAATTERSMILAEIYRRDEIWRIRAVGQGYEYDLATLARNYGVNVDEPAQST
ncbi:MAG: TerD family protein [Gordonia sp. (in: high G+C Gram-positive bacteria)]|nr:TerD family protein [Gordonia sp. (in: high G+C Gram-positive bacteria)]